MSLTVLLMRIGGKVPVSSRNYRCVRYDEWWTRIVPANSQSCYRLHRAGTTEYDYRRFSCRKKVFTTCTKVLIVLVLSFSLMHRECRIGFVIKKSRIGA